MTQDAGSVLPYSPVAERCRRIASQIYRDAKAMRQKAQWYEREAKAWEEEARRLERRGSTSQDPVTFDG